MARKKTTGVRKVGSQYEIDKIVTVDGKRIHVRKSGFSSVQEAREALPALVEARSREARQTQSDKSFDVLCREFEDFRSTQSKSQTIDAIHYLIGKHILPHFSGLPVREALNVERVARWYRAKASSQTDSAARKNKVFTTMRQIIDRAWHWHYISSEAYQDLEDRVQNVKLPSKPKSGRGVWTYEDERKFLASIPQDSIDYPMFSLFCYLGCRLGEFLGLQWRCFDQENGSVAIGQQVIRASGGTLLTSELKTNESYRVNQLDPATASLLIRYRTTLNSSEGDEYMFPCPYDTRRPLSRTEFRRRFNRYIELSGVPKIVPHGVRHSKATMIAGVCRNAEEVAVGAKFLGHSSAMFMGTYVSQTGVQQVDILNRLNGREGR